LNVAAASLNVGGMSDWAGRWRCVALLLLACVLGGCVPGAQSQLDEEKEPYFLEGKSRQSTMDYKGAVESYEKALEVNPQSAAAHFELGCLYDDKRLEKDMNPAVAIYHLERYLKLRPRADNAGIIRTKIMSCKQELASSVLLAPVSQTWQREFERVTEERNRLGDENKKIREELDKWRAYASWLQTLTNQAPAAPSRGPAPAATPAPASSGASASSAPPAHPGTLPSVASRNHTVKSGETLGRIAREYGLSVEALVAANPGLNARKIRVGQTLVVPTR
jgi:LysM repeat protein